MQDFGGGQWWEGRQDDLKPLQYIFMDMSGIANANIGWNNNSLTPVTFEEKKSCWGWKSFCSLLQQPLAFMNVTQGVLVL